MADPGPPASAPVDQGERAALLATKFAVPQVRPDLVPRPLLVERLHQQLAHKLLVVCTPAGFGKTSLLAGWAREAEWPVAWLSLDADDNDPARFWRYLVAALDRVHAGIGEPVLALFTGPTRPSGEAVVTALVNEVAALPEELGLVLDDYHVMESEQVHEAVAFLLGHLPPQLHVVIASRTDPPLPLARLRARGLLGELRAADLRFSLEETAILLQDVWKLELPPEAVGALQDRTEGWVAGLQLAALSLQGRADTAGFIEAFTGTHRFVLDYLSEEVLERQPERVTRFLLETSVLERLCGALCDAVTGGSDGQDVLEELERANLFLIPLDEQRRWYRYHHLFADLLRARLRQARPERVAELHRRAGAWCERHGLVDDAVRHHLAAGEVERAARLIERHVEELLLRTSERATMDRWATALPAQVVRARPRLLVPQAQTALIEGRLDGVDDLLTLAERAPVPEEPHQPSVGRAASVLANLPAVIPVARAEAARLRGQPERAAGFARDALSRLDPEDELLGTFVRYHLACAEWLCGRLEQAERGLAEVVAERQATGERYLAVRASYDLGQVQQARGRLGAATGTYRRALGIVSQPGRPSLPAAGLALVGLAEVLRERDDLDGALRHAVEGIERCRSLAYSPPLARGLVTLAWIRHARGEHDGAVEAMEEAQRAVPSPEVAALHNPAPAERVRLLLIHGRLEEALGWAAQRGLNEGDQPLYPHEQDYLVLARVLLAGHAADRALELLRRLREPAVAQGRVGSVIRIEALRVLALQAAGDHRQALRTLAQTLSLAWPEGYIRVFADEGPAMAALLRRLGADRQRGHLPEAAALPTGYLERLVHAAGRAAKDAAPAPFGDDRAAAQGLVDPLTDRELEVLRLLAAGRRNQEIAADLVVTVETVKKHVTHILDKLGAANRMQAVAHARKLGLLG